MLKSQQQQQQQAQIATLISQSALQTGPAVHTTPFYGRTTEDLLSFLSHFERFSNFCNWDDDQRLRALPLYLQGNTSSWYASFDLQTFKSYNDLLDALKTHFTNPASVWLWRQQLSARKQGEHEPLCSYASDIRHLCKRVGPTELEIMHHFIQGLKPELKSHVILGQLKSLSEDENLANLKEAVLKHTPHVTQETLESQLQSVVASLERLTSTPQNNIPDVAAYNYSRNTPQHDLRHQQYQRGQTKSSGLQHDSDLLAKLVRDEVRRQTSFMTPPSRPSNSGVPSARNRRTTDGLPICNKCNKVGHIARNCRTSTFSHPTGIIYKPAVRQHAQTLQPNSPTFRPNAPTFGSQPRSTNPFYSQQSGN